MGGYIVQGSTLVDGGHFTLAPPGGLGEAVTDPAGARWSAGSTETTGACFAEAARLVQERRRAGDAAQLALLVGDLVVPAGERHEGGSWALPPSYLDLLRAAALGPEDVVVLGEAYCRNQGKRRVLDAARANAADPERTYAEQGWALLADDHGLRLVSDASLDWDADVRSVALTRGAAPLCPLVFAGLKRWAFQRGYAAHVAVYALADDGWIDQKLRGGATALTQLWPGPVGAQVHRLLWADAFVDDEIDRAELLAPGELPWGAFFERAQRVHPGLCRVEEARWSASSSGAGCARTAGASSPSSG